MDDDATHAARQVLASIPEGASVQAPDALLPHLAAMLPDVQLVATTHSPLIALGVESRSVVSLQRREDLGVGRAAVPNLDAFSAEDMLVHEELFDTTPYGPETDEKRATYSKLATLEAAARTPEQTQQLKALAHELQAPLRESPDPILEQLGTIERLLKQGSPS